MQLEGDFETSQNEIAEDIMNWMKSHTLRDLTDIAIEIEENGEDAEEVWEFIRELNGITNNGVIEGLKSSEAVKEPAHA
jgi:hypothetical protein